MYLKMFYKAVYKREISVCVSRDSLKFRKVSRTEVGSQIRNNKLSVFALVGKREIKFE